MNGSYHVFLSYSSNDRDSAINLRTQLERRGLSVFHDVDSIHAGDLWLDRLQEVVDGCGAFVVLVGRDGVTRWIGAEVQCALIRYFAPHDSEQRLPIYPILLRETEANTLPAFLQLFQATQWDGAADIEFSIERAVFVSVLHRLFVSGSDRSCETWMADYAIPGAAALQLHHFYRAMAWLGEEMAPIAEGALAPRCVKDLIEERLFEQRRDLFNELSLVFMDTTTLSFHGAGGATLGAYGHSKDHQPDLKQMVLAVVMDAEGRPICTEMLPGNTADVTVLLPIVERLRKRFAVGRVCVVADRGMIAAATIGALEQRKLEYVLGTRERSSRLIRTVVLTDERSFTPLVIERIRGETQLFVKEVRVGDHRYIVCRNEAEAEKERSDRQAIIAGLETQLRKGDKTLIGCTKWTPCVNSVYRRYLRRVRRADGKPEPAFEIDAGKLAEEARYDGIFVLRTNARITPLQAVLRYRDLIQAWDLFRRAKAILRTRPIYHSSDAAIHGHVFCSFLALILQKELADRCQAAGFAVEWGTLLRDLDRLQEATIEKDGKRITTRTAVTGQVGRVFQATGVALPPNMRENAAA